MVRPIDLQDNFSKAPLVAREQQIQQSSAQNAQQRVAMEANAERILDHSRPVASQELDPQENRVDDHERNQQGHRQRDDADDEPQAAVEADDGSTPADRDASAGDHVIDVVA